MSHNFNPNQNHHKRKLPSQPLRLHPALAIRWSVAKMS